LGFVKQIKIIKAIGALELEDKLNSFLGEYAATMIDNIDIQESRHNILELVAYITYRN
jgi:hypothetical protein